MKRYFLSGLVSCLLASATSAQGVWVETSWTCADWAEARANNNAMAIEQHVVGVLNGVVLASKQDFWRVDVPIDSKQAFFWVDRHCAENPLDILLTGVFALVEERLGKGWNQRNK